MIDSDQSLYYLSYATFCMFLLVAFIRLHAAEGVLLSTKEFKAFRDSFSFAYAAVMLGELLTTASYYHTYIYFGLSLDRITRLYCVSAASQAVSSLLIEVVDSGSRKSKSMTSTALFAGSMGAVLVSRGHYELLLLGRIAFGIAQALSQTSFEAYAVHEHTNRGFPEDWLTNTFTNLTHSLALISALSGALGQSVATTGPLGCIGFCCALYAVVTAYISLSWAKDSNSPKFSLSGYLFNSSQLLAAAKSNRSMLLVMLISTLSEASITIFSFYWAPWITSMVAGETQRIPYEIVYAAYVCVSMLGNYLYQLYGQSIGQDQLFQIVLTSATGAFFLGAVVQTPSMAFFTSLIIQLCIGCYWPCIGLLRGKIVVPELRSVALTMTRVATAIVAMVVLGSLHHSPAMLLTICASLNGAAAFCQVTLTQFESAQHAYYEEDENAGEDDA